jgi:hypothetical protein
LGLDGHYVYERASQATNAAFSKGGHAVVDLLDFDKDNNQLRLNIDA